jgi:hypothetical protein
MYCTNNCNPFFLKFVVHKMNSEMVKSKMVKLTGEKANMVDADMVVGWML